MKIITVFLVAVFMSGCARSDEIFRNSIESVEAQGRYDGTSGGSAGVKFVLRDPRRRITSDSK